MVPKILETADKQVLADVVKKVQKEGLKGTHGSWKEFLDVHDKKFGSSLSDPSRRSNTDLIAFLETFTDKDDLRFLEKVVQCHLNSAIMEQSMNKSTDNGTPGPDLVYDGALKLVRLTLEHPQYPVDYSFPSYDEGWVVMKLNKKPKVIGTPEIVAVDCEMVLCKDGTEALVKVCIVDHNLKVKLDKLVKPNKEIVDYRTEITGITAEHMERDTCSLEDVQESVKKILSPETILIGHSLNKDLRALKIDYARVIDTSFIFKYSGRSSNKRPSLSNLCKEVLDHELREKGKPHNCLDDAKAAMELVLARIKRGVESPIELVEEDVPDIVISKLLIHRIPISLANTELHNVIPGNFEIERKPPKKENAENYSAFAKFKNPEQAQQAFESIKGNLEKDTSGRPQKLVTFQLSTGVVGTFYVRKMVCDDAQVVSKKRTLQAGDFAETKKQKVDKQNQVADPKQCDDNLEDNETMSKEPILADSTQCKDHIKVIENMKDELRRKEYEIKTLNPMVANLRKRRLIKKENHKKKNLRKRRR